MSSETARVQRRTKLLAAIVAALSIVGYYALPNPELGGSPAEPPASPTPVVGHALDSAPRTD